MHDKSALPIEAATPPDSVILMVKQNHRGLFDVVADNVLVNQHGTECEADAHCRRLQAQQEADLIPAR